MIKRLFMVFCLALTALTTVYASEVKPTILDPVANKRVVEVAEQLRCLVCQNQSIADSNAELAVDLKNQVVKQIAAGKTNQEIIDFMVERYGDFVLYNPPFKASTIILWVGPIVLLIAALIALFVTLVRRRQVHEAPLSEADRQKASALLKGLAQKNQNEQGGK